MRGCSSMSPGHKDTSEALRTVSVHGLFLPSASLGMVLAYTRMCSYLQSLIFIWSCLRCHDLLSMCGVTCFVTVIDMFVCMVSSQLHGHVYVLNSHSTLFPLAVFPFPSFIFKRVKSYRSNISHHTHPPAVTRVVTAVLSWHCSS